MKRFALRLLRRWVPRPLKKALIAGSAENLMECALAALKDVGLEPTLIIDVGAFMGAWTAGAARIFPGSRILMIEAQPDKEARLAEMVRSDPRLMCRMALLGAQPRSSVRFYKMESGSSIYAEETHVERSPLELSMSTLDELAADLLSPATRDILLKLDVQGAELDVLAGAARVLERTAAVVMEISLVEYNRGAPLLAEVVAFMRERGFVVFDLAGIHRLGSVLIQVDLVFVPSTSRVRGAWKAAS